MFRKGNTIQLTEVIKRVFKKCNAIFNQIMREKFAEGYGDTLADDPDRTGVTWATFLHLYMPFYTFQYSIGISAAHAIGETVLSGDKKAVANYLDFLKVLI